MEQNDFAQQMASSRSIQGLIRAMSLYCQSGDVTAEFKLEHHPEGAVVHFGASDSIKGRGHEKFAALLVEADRLAFLEHAIETMRDLRVPQEFLTPLMDEAVQLFGKLYPQLPKGGSFSEDPKK